MENKSAKKTIPVPIGVAIAALTLAIGFIGGMGFQNSRIDTEKNANTDPASQVAENGNFPGGNRMGMRGTFGVVSTVTSSSISVTDSRTDQATSYAIVATTKVLNGTVTAAIADIKVGDNVMIQASSTNAKEASQITLNPELPSGPGGAGRMQPGAEDQTEL